MNQNQEVLITDQRDYLLEALPEKCRLLCPVARMEAYNLAVFLIKDSVEIAVVRDSFGNVMDACKGPSIVKVCGAEEDKPTYECQSPIIKNGESVLKLVEMNL